ncbi:52 kDa repressor of the inhibitor of the protein kinase-like [Hydractinia symbiolongicarpus]|uniref:52 kDa repressor of the inhibitor of the protein kinase-like n=1 Tax=Hydractinia symbiolongicarpus TaxID=13093 RepID=UPI00254E2112|nr:52 kDa repressor of the inhibitor of the protein kinase-like [Hydractinia symbiolongicarpus]
MSNLNPGNFLAFVKLAVELECPALKEHMIAQIKRSKYFSVLGDEAVDISNKEQMRYIDSKDKIRETFLKMAECKLGCSGKGLSKTIIDAVEQNNLDMNDCRGQGYDGAGAMAGKCSGASTLIKNKFPKAIYVHCASHRLNLCVAVGCKLPMVADMMSQFQAVALFFYCSPVRTHVLKGVIEAVSPEIVHSVVLNICRTRWVARLDGLDYFCDLLPSVMLTLEKITENRDKSFSRSNMDAARPLLLGICQFEFIAVLVIVQKVLGYTRGLTVKLQSIESDLVKTSRNVLLLKRTLQVIRSDIDTHFNKCCNYVANGVKEYHKLAVAIPFIDHILQELDTRFSIDNLSVYSGFSIMPTTILSDEGRVLVGDQPTWKVEFSKFIQRYRDDIPALSNLYAHMWKVKWRTFTGVLPTTLQGLLKHTDKLLFPSIHEAIRILATIPVTTCTCERSISGLRRVKTWMRNTMTKERLNSLCVIMFNRDVTVDLDQVVDEFAAANKPINYRLNMVYTVL